MTDESIMMILTYIIDMDGMLRLTKGQGQKVKGQGHTYIYGYFLFRL